MVTAIQCSANSTGHSAVSFGCVSGLRCSVAWTPHVSYPDVSCKCVVMMIHCCCSGVAVAMVLSFLYIVLLRFIAGPIIILGILLSLSLLFISESCRYYHIGLVHVGFHSNSNCSARAPNYAF